MLRGVFVGHGPPAVEREAWELRVLGAVILQALEDMQRGDDEAEAWLEEAIGLDAEERWILARRYAPLLGGRRGRMAERVCRHCGGTYRGLACPCRKRAAAAARAREQDRQDGQDGGSVGDRPQRGRSVSDGSADEAIGGSLADGKG